MQFSNFDLEYDYIGLNQNCLLTLVTVYTLYSLGRAAEVPSPKTGRKASRKQQKTD